MSEMDKIYLRTKNHSATCWCIDCARLDMSLVSKEIIEPMEKITLYTEEELTSWVMRLYWAAKNRHQITTYRGDIITGNMRSKVITTFRRLAGTEKKGLTDFVMYGRAIAFQKLDRRQIDRTMKRCINLMEYEFTWKEAIEHFYKMSWLAPEKR